ncbi:hypothetical protein [Cetobacterium somerae]|uniref:hypothetical protein n=1 Tax=Cetobacterium somerae TaxID=188913 RepID=UPI00248DD56D|nr:hypothetical protein [Cetobacterium somerae]
MPFSPFILIFPVFTILPSVSIPTPFVAKTSILPVFSKVLTSILFVDEAIFIPVAPK